MADSVDTNAAIWKSEEVIRQWVTSSGERDAKRAGHWRIMAELLPFQADQAFTFLDLGAGTGAASAVILDLYSGSRGVLTDYSPQMMREGKRALERHEGRFEYLEYDLLEPTWPEGVPAHVDAVITSLCVHHLPDERKWGLFGEIFQRLSPGGWYLNYDPVSASDPVVDEAWERANAREDPEAAVRSLHRTPEEQQRYENHVRYIIPLEPQVDRLRAIGFEGVDVYWKHFDNVIYGGRRPAS